MLINQHQDFRRVMIRKDWSSKTLELLGVSMSSVQRAKRDNPSL